MVTFVVVVVVVVLVVDFEKMQSPLQCQKKYACGETQYRYIPKYTRRTPTRGPSERTSTSNVDRRLDTADCKNIYDCLLVRCDDLFSSQKVNTYVNLSLNQESHIDYVLVSDASDVSQSAVLDPDVNFSDYLPLFTVLTFPCGSCKATTVHSCNKPGNLTLPQLR